MPRILHGLIWVAVGCADASPRAPPLAAPPAFEDDASYIVGSSTPPVETAVTDDASNVDTAAGPVEPADAAPSAPDDAAAEASRGGTGGAVPEGACAGPLRPGDLAIVELMIESVAGTGDHGEWLEIRSTRDCAVDLRGLQGTCPRGAKVASFEIGADVWLAPQATFLVADSTDPVLDHELPGRVVAWSGSPGDVLRNKGTTVTLTANGAIIDTVTYPSLPLTVGASLAFPDDCDGGLRSDWSRWQTSTSSWFPGFFGTPNQPNVDVTCP